MMKRNLFRNKFIAAGMLLGFFSGGLLMDAVAQVRFPDSDGVLMGYIGEDSDYKKKYNLFYFDAAAPVPATTYTIFPSLLNTQQKELGRVTAGTWVKGEYHCITYRVVDGQGYAYYLVYEPLTQSLKNLGASKVAFGPGAQSDMTYVAQTGEIYVLGSTTTQNILYKMLPDNTNAEQLGDWITIDGMQAKGRFKSLSANSEGELIATYDDGTYLDIYKIDPENCSASLLAETTIKSTAGQFSGTFQAHPDTLYVKDGVGTLYKINITDGSYSGVGRDYLLSMYTTGLVWVDYKDGAPVEAITDLRVVKNPSDYKEATFYYTLPSSDLLGNPIDGKVRVEIYKGTGADDMVLVDSILDQDPGKNLSYTVTSEEEGMAYFAFRVQTENGFYSVFSGMFCPFFDVTFPYRTSFEIDDEKGVVNPNGPGWQRSGNIKVNDWSDLVDTVVRTGMYSYGVIADSVSSLEVGQGLTVYQGVEYEVSFYAVGYGQANMIYGGRFLTRPEKPLRVTVDGTDTLVTLPDRASVNEKPWQYFTQYTFRFVAKGNGPLKIVFQSTHPNDAYHIDDLEIKQLGLSPVPAVITDLALVTDESDFVSRKATVSFTAPDQTLNEEPLSDLSGVVVEWSRYRNFSDEEGAAWVLADTVKSLTPGNVGKVTRMFDEEGFYYARAYAYNTGGSAPLSDILVTGYLGESATVDFKVDNTEENTALANIAIALKPLYPEREEAYTATTSETGQASISDVYFGKYTVEFTHELYDTYTADVTIGKDTAIEVTLSDKVFYKYPVAVSNLAVGEIDHETLTVSLSWKNPALDIDGNELTAIEGVIVSYQVENGPLTVLDTVKENLEAGANVSAEIKLNEQGRYVLSLSAYNEFGRSEETTVAAGYVGEGFAKPFVCEDTEGEIVENVRITLIALNDTVSYTATGGEDGKVTLNGVRRGMYELYATADYYDRMIKDSVEVEDGTESVLEFSFTLQQPEITGLQMPSDNSVTFTWSLKEDRHFTDGFESYPDFEIEKIGDYKLGGEKSKGQFGGVTWPNMFEDQSYIVFNPSATSPSLGEEVYWDVHSGKKMLCSFFTIRNDDWLAHRVEGAGTLKFWAAGPQISGSPAERFVVLYSTTDDNFGNFIKISEGQYVEAEKEWKEYSYQLPANAKYFAIHCVSDDASVFKLDDLSYTLDHGAKISPATGFELYVNDTKVATLESDASTYTFSNLPDGQHTLGLKAVYENGTSEMVTRTVTVGRQVVEPINVQVKKISGEWVLSYEMPSGETAEYYAVFLDGRFLEYTPDQSYILPPSNPNEEHTAGVSAVNNAYFSDTIWVEFSEVANESAEEQLLSVYPNPAVDGTFRLVAPADGMLEIFAVDGKKVYTREITAGIHEISLPNQPKGVYMISLSPRNGTRMTTRLMIVR